MDFFGPLSKVNAEGHHALATSTGYAGRRPLPWLACNVPRAQYYYIVFHFCLQLSEMKNLSASNRIGNFSKICGIVREQFQFLEKIIAFPQVIMTFSSLPLKATHRTYIHSGREEVTM